MERNFPIVQTFIFTLYVIFFSKVSDQVLSRLKIHIQLLKYSYVGQDTSLGFAKIQPEDQIEPKQAWLKYGHCELFVESMIIRGTSKSSTSSMTDPVQSVPEMKSGSPELLTAIDPDTIILDVALQNNELFMEFHDYLSEFKAPPYLQFLMNFDAFRQFTAMELGVDPKLPEAIDNYFKSGELSQVQKDQLKMIKHDAFDLFNTHFGPVESAKYHIPMNEEILRELSQNLKNSDLVQGNQFAGKLIGPNLFEASYKWIYNVLEEVYFEKFKESSVFKNYREKSQAFPANFTFADDKMSVLSLETSQIPHEMEETRSVTIIQDIFNENTIHSIENGGQICDDTEMDIKKISTAISILKQQLAVIEDKIEASDGLNLDSLLKTKRNLELQVQSLMNLVHNKDNNLDSSSDFWLDLRNVSIKVSPSKMDHDMSTDSLFSSDPVFDIEVLRDIHGDDEIKPSSMTLSVVSRSYADFEAIHRSLKKQFPKLAKLNFPSKDNALLSELLERYLQLLISDEFIRQSHQLREFVTIDSNLETKTLTSTAGNLVEAVVGKRMKNALQSATSILSVGLISSGKSSKSTKFYETREHHTTSDIRSEGTASLSPDLHRSRSTSSFVQEPSATTEKISFSSAPPTPMKSPPLSNLKTEIIVENDSNPSVAVFSVDEFSESEMDMLLETGFTFITETFDLKAPNQWLRRKVLSVSKQLLKQAYGETFSKSLTEKVNDSLKEDSLLQIIEILTNVLWPNGIFIKDVPPPDRSIDQQLSTQIEARTLLLQHIPTSIQNMTGHYNAVSGMTRIFNLLQDKEFNKIFFMTVLDITVKILFGE